MKSPNTGTKTTTRRIWCRVFRRLSILQTRFAWTNVLASFAFRFEEFGSNSSMQRRATSERSYTSSRHILRLSVKYRVMFMVCPLQLLNSQPIGAKQSLPILLRCHSSTSNEKVAVRIYFNGMTCGMDMPQVYWTMLSSYLDCNDERLIAASLVLALVSSECLYFLIFSLISSECLRSFAASLILTLWSWSSGLFVCKNGWSLARLCFYCLQFLLSASIRKVTMPSFGTTSCTLHITIMNI